jgi:hypothetical protein
MSQPASIPVIQKRSSTLATRSLIFSCCGIFTPLFIGSIIGIVYGHRAMKEFARDPELEGRQKAKWGLIIGYGYIIIAPLLVIAALYLFGGICGGGLLTR